MSAMLGALLASFERRKASERTRDALKRRFEAGAAIGGAAYGYRVERNGGPYAHYAIEAGEAQTVRDVFTWYDEAAGIGRIVKRLNAASVPSPRGGAWCVASVKPAAPAPDLCRAARVGPLQEQDARRHTQPASSAGGRVVGARGARADAARPRAVGARAGAAGRPRGQLPPLTQRAPDRPPTGRRRERRLSADRPARVQSVRHLDDSRGPRPQRPRASSLSLFLVPPPGGQPVRQRTVGAGGRTR